MARRRRQVSKNFIPQSNIVSDEIYIPNHSGIASHVEAINTFVSIAYGEIYTNDNTSTTSISSAGFTQFVFFDTNGKGVNTTPDHTENHITINKAGHYMVDICCTIGNASGAGHKIEIVVAKNNGNIFPNLRRHRTLGSGTDFGAIPVCGHVKLEVGDTMELWLSSDSGAAKDVIVEDISFMVSQVGL